MMRLVPWVVSLCLVVGSAAVAAPAEESTSRNPIPGIALSTLCGAAAGLLLGGAVALVAGEEDEDDDEILKWSFVAGTFIGFGYGIYHATKNPKTNALLELREGLPILHAVLPTNEPGRGMTMRLLSATF
jgi:hypothetical protein